MDRPFEVLLVEDEPADVDLTRMAFVRAGVPVELHVAKDAREAQRFLSRDAGFEAASRPDLILLDLNLPGRDGSELLEEIKHDEELRTIPVVVLTSSRAERDIAMCYRLRANAYVSKPNSFSELRAIIDAVESFWFATAQLPPAD